MKRAAIITSLSFLLILSAKAQVFYLGGAALLHTGSEASLTYEMNVDLRGELDNQGMIELKKGVDFHQNVEVGNVSVTGSADQMIIGQTLELDNLKVDKQQALTLMSSDVEIDHLDLASGVLVADASNHLTVLDSITGGSDQSYVQGTLSRRSGAQSLRYPMGNGESFADLIFWNVPSGTNVSVAHDKLDVENISFGDSIVGIADEMKLTVEHDGAFSSMPQMDLTFRGIDLENSHDKRDIRADWYEPVIVWKPAESTTYLPAVTGEWLDTDSKTYGTLMGAANMPFHHQQFDIAVGMRPVGSSPKFYVPNAFSPNAQLSENRKFRPYLDGYQIGEVKITIWDQFNNRIYSNTWQAFEAGEIGWDGKTKDGKKVSEGVYFYSVAMETEVGLFDKKGTVILLK